MDRSLTHTRALKGALRRKEVREKRGEIGG